jgi:hypothetical protein
MRGKSETAVLRLLLVLPVIALLNTGCLTPSLWKAQIHEPARDPNLNLAVAPDGADVLVQYNEHEPDKVRHRSYWLFDHQTFDSGTGKPKFVRQKSYADLDLTPIPLAEQNAADDAVSASGFVAVPAVGNRSFELRRDGVPLGHFQLPVYKVDAKPTFGRIALTPLAAVGDGVIAAGAAATVVGGVVLIGALESSDDDTDYCAPAHNKSGGLHATHRSD